MIADQKSFVAAAESLVAIPASPRIPVDVAEVVAMSAADREQLRQDLERAIELDRKRLKVLALLASMDEVRAAMQRKAAAMSPAEREAMLAALTGKPQVIAVSALRVPSAPETVSST